MTANTCDVVIVGGGLHGLSAAIHLRQAGLQVTVIEKDHCGRHASGVNAGGVRRLGRHLAEVPLSVEAMKMWHTINDFVDDDCEFTACGQIKVAETDDELAELTARAQQVKNLGFDHEQIIVADELRARVPAVAGHCVGALVCDGDGSANPFRTVMAFKRKAITLGVVIREGETVENFKRQAGVWSLVTSQDTYQAPNLVNAAGAWSAQLATQIGESVPLTGQALMLMITERVEPLLTPVLGAATRTLSFKQFANGTIMIGGGQRGRADLSSNLAQTRLAGMTASARIVHALFPQLDPVRVNRCWAGIEGMTPDDIPVIGKSSTEEGCFHSFGYCGHGYQMSPITGRIMCELVTQGESQLPIDAFNIARFKAA